MRDYGKVAPTFWTGDTGRKLRNMGPRVQLVALYLVTGPHANMLGLYYMPLPVLCHETGIPLEGALKALASLSEGGFAWYDRGSEVVWIPEMARFQIGETVVPKDHRHKGLVRELEKYRKSAFYAEFYRRYRDPYHLPDPSPLEAPSEPLSSQEQEQEQEEEQDQEQEQKKRRSPFIPPTEAEVRAYCEQTGKPIDAAAFVAFYGSKGWMVGKNKMTDWHKAAAGWYARDQKNGTKGNSNGTTRNARPGGLRYDPAIHGEVTPVEPDDGGGV